MMRDFKLPFNFNGVKLPFNFNKYKGNINFSNIKIPYLIYPVIAGLMIGWLISVIISSFFVEAKPMPIASARKTVTKVPIDSLSKKAIETNLFNLATTPVTVDVSTTNNSSSSNGEPVAPPFTAKLIGILKDNKGVNSIAIISVDNNTFSIKVGKEKNGITLVALEDYTAIIMKNNTKYSIKLDKSESQISNVHHKRNNTTQSSGSSDPVITTSGSNINISLKREDVQSELKDLNKILQSALVSPFYENGEFKGYRVTRMKDSSPLKKLGFQTGDTITRINGSDLKSPEILFNMLSQIDDITAISVDMIRNAEKKTLFVEIQ